MTFDLLERTPPGRAAILCRRTTTFYLSTKKQKKKRGTIRGQVPVLYVYHKVSTSYRCLPNVKATSYSCRWIVLESSVSVVTTDTGPVISPSSSFSTKIGELSRLSQPMPNLHLSLCLSSRCSEVCSTDGCEYHQDEDPVTKFSSGLVKRGWLLKPGQPTRRISSSSIQPLTSVLLAKTSKLAPESRFYIVSQLSSRTRCATLEGIRPLPGADRGVRSCSLRFASGRSRPLPR